jgi:hypothetical protein
MLDRNSVSVKQNWNSGYPKIWKCREKLLRRQNSWKNYNKMKERDGGKKLKLYKKTLISFLNKRILNGSNRGNKIGTKLVIETLISFMYGQVIDPC